MDKARFVEKAPFVYAVAIVHYLESTSGDAYDQDIRNRFSGQEEDGPEYHLLTDRALFHIAMTWLMQQGMVDLIEDDFGPPIIQATENFQAQLRQLKADRSLPFYGYGRAQNERWWLFSALEKLATLARELGIRDEDYGQASTGWSPIPLDRDDPLLQSVIARSEEVIEHVRGANGYAETAPEERAYVTDGLTAFAKHLKTAATISRPYIERFALEPLRTLARRFKDDATGVVVKLAIEGIKQWLRSKGFPVP